MKSKNLSLSALNEEVRYLLRRNCAVIGSEKNNILVNMVGCGYFLADIIESPFSRSHNHQILQLAYMQSGYSRQENELRCLSRCCLVRRILAFPPTLSSLHLLILYHALSLPVPIELSPPREKDHGISLRLGGQIENRIRHPLQR